MNTFNRGNYGEIIIRTLDSELRSQVEKLVSDAQSAAKVDEHGNWDFGAEFDRKGRGHALNWDLYAVGNDVHSGKILVVIQIRQWSKTRKNGYANVRKNYFLLGTNEDESTFAHPVSSNVIHAAIRTGKDVCLAVQNWIFDGDYSRMVRQGDLALVPMSKRPAAPTAPRKRMFLQQSHELVGTAIRQNGNLYVKNPTMYHIPGTHPIVSGEGWYKVIVGNRAEFWKFAVPTID